MDKRIYSINLGVYIFYETGIMPEIAEDEDKANVFYFVFPEKQEISKAINDYRDELLIVNLRRYLRSYAQVREKIKQLTNK